MASEYLKWKYRDVKPDEPPPPLEGWPKIKNWLHYHMIYLLAAAVVLGVAGSMVWNALGIGQVEPDYIFAYVGKNALPADTAAALQRELAALGEDVNGDGQVTVELRSYVSGGEADPEYGAAASVTLMADITRGESVFFLTDDPQTLQVQYQILAGPDGALPDADDYGWEDKALLWADCPALTALPLGAYREEMLGQEVSGESQELLSGLYIGRRGFYDPKQDKHHDANLRLWNVITKGALLSP